jgi:hypothetical protein
MDIVLEFDIYGDGVLKLAELEASILEAARKNDDHLDDLLQVACETMEEEQCNRLLDKVHQIMSEDLRDLRNWKG